MEQSILKSTKKILNIPPDDLAFDLDILTHINSVFGTLNQLGIGPADGFAIEDDSAEWDVFLEGNKLLNPVRSYMFLRVRLLFDPPGTSFAIEAAREQIKELEWRLNATREEVAWTDPNVPVVP